MVNANFRLYLHYSSPLQSLCNTNDTGLYEFRIRRTHFYGPLVYVLTINEVLLYHPLTAIYNLMLQQSYHLSDCGRDVLCFMTSWNLVCIVELCGDKLTTRGHGSIEVLGGQPTSYAAIMRVDQEHGLIGIMAFTGYLHTISLSAALFSPVNQTAQ